MKGLKESYRNVEKQKNITTNMEYFEAGYKAALSDMLSFFAEAKIKGKINIFSKKIVKEFLSVNDKLYDETLN